MNVAIRRPTMTRDAFLDWAVVQEVRYEFDGFGPVAMGGVTRSHAQICRNILLRLSSRLRGTGCEALGPDVGIATADDAVRFPDALVTCTAGPGTARLIPGVVVVFEVISPSSGRTDRIVKLAEYRTVPSLRHYVIVESATAAATQFSRANGEAGWLATPLTAEGMLDFPEIAVDLPVAALFDGVDLPDDQPPK